MHGELWLASVRSAALDTAGDAVIRLDSCVGAAGAVGTAGAVVGAAEAEAAGVVEAAGAAAVAMAVAALDEEGLSRLPTWAPLLWATMPLSEAGGRGSAEREAKGGGVVWGLWAGGEVGNDWRAGESWAAASKEDRWAVPRGGGNGKLNWQKTSCVLRRWRSAATNSSITVCSKSDWAVEASAAAAAAALDCWHQR